MKVKKYKELFESKIEYENNGTVLSMSDRNEGIEIDLSSHIYSNWETIYYTITEKEIDNIIIFLSEYKKRQIQKKYNL